MSNRDDFVMISMLVGAALSFIGMGIFIGWLILR
jgi:hypothetical protein